MTPSPCLSDSLEDEYSSFSSLMQHILYIWRNIKCAKQSYGMACIQKKKKEKTICYKILSASKRVIAARILSRERKAASFQIY